MTDVTLQGDGDGVRDCDACALSNWARVYAEGAHTCMHTYLCGPESKQFSTFYTVCIAWILKEQQWWRSSTLFTIFAHKVAQNVR